LSDERGVSFWQPDMRDPRLNTSRHNVFNLSRPERSLILLAPLSKSDGGWGRCTEAAGKPVFLDRQDPGYQALLAMCEAGRDYLEVHRRFDMPGFQPRPEWFREMRRYGVLGAGQDGSEPVDFYEVEQRYWRSLWPMPEVAGR
jgi:hypothetical protein